MNKRQKIFDNPIFKTVIKIISWVVLTFLVLVALLLIYNIVSQKLHEVNGQKYEPEIALYTIISPSMEPNINVYDVVITKKVRDYSKIKVGDVITFISSSSLGEGLTVTHRVKDIIVTDDDIKFRTQGDNNPIPDSALASSKNVMGKVLFKVPWVGHIQFFLQSKGGWLFALLIPAMVIVIYDVYKVIRLTNIKQKVNESTKEKPNNEELVERKEKLKKNLEEKYKNTTNKKDYYIESEKEENTQIKEKEDNKLNDANIVKPIMKSNKPKTIDETTEPVKVEEVSVPDNRSKKAKESADTRGPQKVNGVAQNKKIDINKVLKNIDKLEKSEKEFNVDNIMANISKVQEDDENFELPRKR